MKITNLAHHSWEEIVAHGGVGQIRFARLIGSEELSPSSAMDFVDHARIPPGSSIGAHRHDASTEVYVVLEGKARYLAGEDWIRVGPGDVLLNDGGRHALINDGVEEVEILVFQARSADPAMRPRVTVVTVSNRPHRIAHALAQVDGQDLSRDAIEHLVVLDGIEAPTGVAQGALATFVPGNAEASAYRFERLGALRNLGIELANGDTVALLDDDNDWTPDHLPSLLGVLDRNPDLAAVHSWRELWRQGQPHPVDTYPWVLGGDEERQRVLFDAQVSAGILRLGDHRARDRHGFPCRGQLFSCVDAGEWLVRRSLFRDIPFSAPWTYTELLYGYCDDYRFARRLLEANVAVGCSEQFTLRYSLGGGSQVAP